MLDRRALGLLAVAAGLMGCTAGPQYANRPGAGSLPPAELAKLAILVPLKTGNALGPAMVNAAHVALDVPGSPSLEALDTGSSPATAADAARTAIAHGAKLIIGPLTAGDTAAVAPIAKAAGVPVLAFTSDATRAQPGVWAMGLTPAQQVRRLVIAAQSTGKSRFAAALPNGPFGDALADGLRAATSGLSLLAPTIRRYGNATDRSNVLKSLTGRGEKKPSSDADTTADSAETRPNKPVPFDVLLLAENGAALKSMTSELSSLGVTHEEVRLIGPSTWVNEVGKNNDLVGAWYAAPDPAARASFVQRYQAKYGGPPPPLADLAYDTAAIGRVLAQDHDFTTAGLTRPDGFAGVDGVLGLLPSGQVRRGLAVFTIGRTGASIVQPAPQALSPSGV